MLVAPVIKEFDFGKAYNFFSHTFYILLKTETFPNPLGISQNNGKISRFFFSQNIFQNTVKPFLVKGYRLFNKLKNKLAFRWPINIVPVFKEKK